ncbi:MAG: sulfatase, partial [Coraliomargarita sp.]
MIDRQNYHQSFAKCSMRGAAKRLLALASVALSCSMLGHANAHAGEERPNVLFVVVDDLNVDLACYGHEIVQTPNLDRLRERSMVFERAYSQYPLCNPSRNSFLTGLYPGTSGNLDNGQNIREVLPEVVTLPEMFKQNGYRSITTGKVFHQKDPRSWTHISNMQTGGLLPTDEEPEFYHDNHWGQEGRTRGEGRLLADETVRWFEWRSVTEGEEFLKDGQAARATIKRIDEVVADEVPFFMAVGFARPHDPFFAPKRFFDMYPLESLELPTTPEDASEVPLYAYYDVFKRAFDTMDETAKLEAMRSYYAGISYMDEQLGVVLDYMEQAGLMDSTIVVFMSDHGYQVGEKGYWNKAILFERSCQAPLLIALPEMKHAGAASSSLVELIDVYPTLAELCGLEAPENLDGKSLVPLLQNPDASHRDYSYAYVNADRSVRDERYRYVVWSGGSSALYD